MKYDPAEYELVLPLHHKHNTPGAAKFEDNGDVVTVHLEVSEEPGYLAEYDLDEGIDGGTFEVTQHGASSTALFTWDQARTLHGFLGRILERHAEDAA